MSAVPNLESSRRVVAGLSLPVALALLVGCGGGDPTSATDPPAPASTPPPVEISMPAAGPALQAKVPADLKKAGSIEVAVSPDTPPLKLREEDGETVTGAEVELVQAVNAKLGLTTTWQTADWVTLLPALKDGKYDMAVSVFFITPSGSRTLSS